MHVHTQQPVSIVVYRCAAEDLRAAGEYRSERDAEAFERAFDRALEGLARSRKIEVRVTDYVTEATRTEVCGGDRLERQLWQAAHGRVRRGAGGRWVSR